MSFIGRCTIPLSTPHHGPSTIKKKKKRAKKTPIKYKEVIQNSDSIS